MVTLQVVTMLRLELALRLEPRTINATAIGANATATCSNCVVIGSINGLNTATADANVGIGVTNPSQRLQVSGVVHSTTGGFKFPDGTTQTTAATGGVTSVTASSPLSSSGGATPDITLTGIIPISLGGTGSAIQNFVDLSTAQTVGGAKTFSGVVNTAQFFSIGGNRILSNAGTENLFLGVEAGLSNTTGFRNTFTGYRTGFNNTTGNANTFMGWQAGNLNTSGTANTFIGDWAGSSNTAGNTQYLYRRRCRPQQYNWRQ